MQAILGVLFHFIGGFASGSFYVPYKRVRKWAWESYWIIGGLFSWLIIPPIAAALTIPGFFTVIRATDATTLGWTYTWGVLWGIGGLTYGLGIRYLGMSLGNSVLLGLTAALGALLPAIYYNYAPQPGKISLSHMLHSSGGQWVLAGVAVCLAGIALCGLGGRRKEQAMEGRQPQKANAEFNLRKGLILAVVSGVLSACFNYGIEAGKPMAAAAVDIGHNPLFQNNVTYIVLLWGGLTTNFIWCLLLNLRNRTMGNYVDRSTPLLNNYIFSALAGITWYLQFFFYGMGESKLGNGASSWILHMAFIILVSNGWGLFLKEWKGAPGAALRLFISGLGAILLSVLLVAYGNSLGT
ncbi:MAG: L-rhamnose/proton symporter RhaT [Candidatus Pseudobacter hemicellulosilyticus]|uniref:L-rhamnose/proton symporter RhaT n=1 Tax=Candidatus Pseudobacter hemicellulosilyticus TaxID=3121375 RepID=A0AAJ5WNK2_9BACT|nr:MAG: L-rhamnose/proton symporter RhaT [Pseudobacter sp.]